jgi:hypothetical protein
MSKEEWSMYPELSDLEDTLLKLKQWQYALEYLGDYYSWMEPDIEWLLEHYTSSSALFWAFERDFYRLTEEANERYDKVIKKHGKLRKKLQQLEE